LETEYNGTWLFGLKHGKGTQSYLDGSLYIGEFAKGYEHGNGRLKCLDGTCFDGKYRFGKRDGPGVFTTTHGSVIERGVYRDKDCFQDVYPPLINEISLDSIEDNFTLVEKKSDEIYPLPFIQFYDPPSLMIISLTAAAKYLQPKLNPDGSQSSVITPFDVSRILPDHIKSYMCEYFIKRMEMRGSNDFREFVLHSNIGFNSPGIQ
jgi:hypothetical protein